VDGEKNDALRSQDLESTDPIEVITCVFHGDDDQDLCEPAYDRNIGLRQKEDEKGNGENCQVGRSAVEYRWRPLRVSVMSCARGLTGVHRHEALADELRWAPGLAVPEILSGVAK